MSIFSERLTQLRKERELTLEMLVADLSVMFPDITINIALVFKDKKRAETL